MFILGVDVLCEKVCLIKLKIKICMVFYMCFFFCFGIKYCFFFKIYVYVLYELCSKIVVEKIRNFIVFVLKYMYMYNLIFVVC